MKKYCFLLILLLPVLVSFTPAAEASFFVQAFSGPSKADTSRYVGALTNTPSRAFSSGAVGYGRQSQAAGPVASAPQTPSRLNDSTAPEPKPRKDLTITWDSVPAPNLRGYRLYYDTDAGPPYAPAPADYAAEGPSPLTLAADVTTLTLHGLTANKDYFFSVTAFTGNDSPESEYSVEVVSHSLPAAILPAENSVPSAENQEAQLDNESRNTTLSQPEPPALAAPGPSAPNATATLPSPAENSPGLLPAPEPGNESRNAALIAALQAIPEDIEPSPAGSQESFATMSKTLLAPGDIIQISIPSMPNLSQNYDVDPEGNLFIASIGSMPVKDITLAAFQKLLEEMLNQFYALREKPDVRLIASKRFIQISGGIQYPGWYRVKSEEKLADLISLAGGLLEGVDPKDIKLLRKTEAGIKSLPVSETMQFNTSDNLTVPPPDSTSIKVDNGDLLYLRVPMERSTTGEKEIQDATNRSQVEVDRYGYLTVPLYGNIFVKGMTTTDIIRTITEKLPKYLAQSADVKVNIIEKRHYVQVLGHVANPGWHNIPESANVQTALNTAGGILDGAIMSEIGVIRQTPAGPRKIMVNLFQYSISGDERLLSPLHEDDTIFVPIAAAFGNVKRTLASWSPPDTKLEKDSTQKVRITGAVNAPGVYEPTKDMDLLEILILAKGESDIADLSNIQVIRDTQSTVYNLTQLLQDSKPLPKIQSGDTVRVGYMERSGYKSQASEEKVRIFGAISKPGGYDIKGKMNLIDLITLAGGERDNADLSDIKIFRADGSTEAFNMNKVLLEDAGGYKNLPVLYSGDAVRIGYLESTAYRKKSTGQKVRIFGGVNRPAAFEATEEMHLIDLIALAGGETDIADLSNIKIFRATGGTETFNLNKVMQETGGAGFAELPKIYAGDAVRIGYLEREGYKRKSTDKKVRIYGAVVKSGAYEPDKDMHLIDLLILASGEQEIADLSNITIFRDSGAAEKFNLNQFLQDNPEGGYREMPRVYGGDTVHVAYLERQDYRTAESIYVLGQARSNGEYQLDDHMTVLQALALAGGLADYADTENIMILRTVDGKQINIPYNLEMGITGKYPELNIRLRPNDVVYVP